MKLLAAISHHGFGHLAQATPVLNALAELCPDLDLTIWSGLPTTALASRLHGHFQHRHDAADVGLTMHDAMRVNVPASHAAYLDFHADWPARVEHEAAWLRDSGFAAVFSDVAALPLAAAAQAGIPGIALCSLNWVDIAGAYLGERPGMAAVLEQLTQAYRSARVFFQPQPSMPMDWLDRREIVPPIAAVGVNRRRELQQRLGSDRLVLVGFGGVDLDATLYPIPRVTWLVPDTWALTRPDLVPFSRTGLHYLDLLASADALITKVGYGSFVETAAAGVPVLYLDRPEWPETPVLATWLRQHAQVDVIAEAELFTPAIGACLAALWSQPRQPPIAAAGAAVVARRLLECL